MRFALREWWWITSQHWRFQRQQSGPWRTMTLCDVPIAPIEELLRRWAGGSIWRGGPQTMPWHGRCPGMHHYRGDQPADDPALHLDDAAHWPKETGRLFWCGPIVNHFGHQLGEFGGRVLMASLDRRRGSLLFLHPEGDRRFDELLPWQQEWIRYLNPCRKPVLIRRGGFHAQTLVVVPQQQRLGACPSPAMLRALTRLGRQHLSAAPIEEVVVFSRAEYAKGVDGDSLRGSIAAESAFDAWMASRGARIVYPEILPFREQLALLHNAKRLVVAEGSALHALELIGRQPHKQVVVMARRPLWAGMDHPLRSRFPRLHWLDAVRELHWREPANPRVKGVARLDWRQALTELNRCFGFAVTDQDAAHLEAVTEAQLAHLSETLAMRKQVCGAKERQAIRAGGW